jgi:23S rRNA (cytidine1920-2'-O)/16S rRNA (cytidine1409-2'-O)-methyltransferase
MSTMDYSRLDFYMHEIKLAESRNKARELILGGQVTVNGEPATKPSAAVPENALIYVSELPKYVSRAGYKLETAVEAFGIDFTDKICLDAGASTGGFADLMLQKGAKRIYAVDVGENQLHQSLREHHRVLCIEKQDVRTLVLPERADFIAADLSFISLKGVIPVFGGLLAEGGACVVLIKPQFEAGKVRFKNGILKDQKVIDRVVFEVEQVIRDSGFEIIGTIPSKLNHKNKNREYLCYFKNV